MAVYIALGFVFALKAESYLLLGIPMTLVFQKFIARQNLHKLWLRDEEKFHLNKKGLAITLCFIVYPIYKTSVDMLSNNISFVSLGYDFAAILGAFCAGFAYSKFTKKTMFDLFLCFFITLFIRIGIYFLPFLMGKQIFDPDIVRALKSLLLYIPIAFVVEEVVFRGMFDNYIEPKQNPYKTLSALFICLLWGLWHLPLSRGGNPIWFVALGSMLISLWGILLSVFWRRTGNLAVPGLSHAFADAIRDGLK